MGDSELIKCLTFMKACTESLHIADNISTIHHFQSSKQ